MEKGGEEQRGSRETSQDCEAVRGWEPGLEPQVQATEENERGTKYSTTWASFYINHLALTLCKKT